MINKLTGYLVVCLLFGGCAQKKVPMGGPKDIIPPKIIISEPANEALNVTPNRIYLEFDEYIKSNGLTDKLIISPSLKYPPEIKIGGKIVEVLIKDTLLQNTTYSINFGDGIVDNNEGNKLDSNLFVFSTGDYIDSLQLTGTIKRAFDLVPLEGVKVMLYSSDADSLPYKSKPDYFAMTDKSGRYELNYLKPGSYTAFALKEENNNYLYDDAEEQIGFRSENIELTGADTLNLLLFEEKSDNQYLKKIKDRAKGKLVLIYNIPVTNPEFELINQEVPNWFVPEYGVNGDTITIWMANVAEYSEYQIRVSDGDFIDTINYEFDTDLQYPQLKLSGLLHNGNQQHVYRELVIKSNTPIKQVDVRGFYFIRKSTDTVLVADDLIKFSDNTIIISEKFEEGVSMQLLVLPMAITDYFGNQSDTFKLDFEITHYHQYANAELSLTGVAAKHILQLLNGKGSVINENIVNDETKLLIYRNLSPGTYKMKLITDANQDGIWNTGNYTEQIQPEKVIYYSGELKIRAGWDVELKWEVK